MSPRQVYFGTSSRNPLVQILSLIVFGVLLVGAVIMGAFVLVVVLGLAVIAAAVFSVRLWWIRRKLERAGAFDAAHREGEEHTVIEGEFEVLESDESDERRRRPPQ